MSPPEIRVSPDPSVAQAVVSARADVDSELAAALGFLKLKYVAVERERRWLCREVPRNRIVRGEAITDLYITGTRLRLREARPLDGGAPMLRLSRKADVDAETRLITSIYLLEEEFRLLASALRGDRIAKLRHRLEQAPTVVLSVDEFQGDLAGLIIAEAEFETPEQLAGFPIPDFAVREVTTDIRFTGAYLARNGLPKNDNSAT
jgi:CYTH domain-containing protein